MPLPRRPQQLSSQFRAPRRPCGQVPRGLALSSLHPSAHNPCLNFLSPPPASRAPSRPSSDASPRRLSPRRPPPARRPHSPAAPPPPAAPSRRAPPRPSGQARPAAAGPCARTPRSPRQSPPPATPPAIPTATAAAGAHSPAATGAGASMSSDPWSWGQSTTPPYPAGLPPPNPLHAQAKQPRKPRPNPAYFSPPLAALSPPHLIPPHSHGEGVRLRSWKAYLSPRTTRPLPQTWGRVRVGAPSAKTPPPPKNKQLTQPAPNDPLSP